MATCTIGTMRWILWQQSNFILPKHQVVKKNCVSTCPSTILCLSHLSSCTTQHGLNTDSGHFSHEVHFDGISNKFLELRIAECSELVISGVS